MFKHQIFFETCHISSQPLNWLQNNKGRNCDENARRWVDTREEDRQDFPSDGQEYGWKALIGGVHRGWHLKKNI